MGFAMGNLGTKKESLPNLETDINEMRILPVLVETFSLFKK